MRVLRGVGVSHGRRVAPAARMAPPLSEPPAQPLVANTDREAAAQSVDAASQQVRGQLQLAAAGATGQAAEILTVTAAMAGDPSLVRNAQASVRDDGVPPAHAVWTAAQALAAQLTALGGNMAERATDVRDVRDRIVAHLTGEPRPGVPVREEPYVLVAHDLAPVDTASLSADLVVAIVTSTGGPTSHTSILARGLGIPCVVATEGADAIADGDLTAVDGSAGEVVIEPDAHVVKRYLETADAPTKLTGPGATKDGCAVALLANIGDPDGAEGAAAAGAEGVGLFRTEFCFLGREQAPSVAEQVEQYSRVFAAFAGRKVVIRTLDAGADKPLPFVTAADEPNPALGVRGLRTSWDHPEVLDGQLAAIAAAQRGSQAEVYVMAPMVATVGESEAFVAACARHGIDRAGVMIEVPSAALRAKDLLASATFASVGTNDLTQYTVASDRELAALAELSTPWQPAVLDLIAIACEGGAHRGRPIGVCGEAAADPALAPVLVGMGVTSLSMTARSLPAVAAVLATLTMEQCRDLATLARAATSAPQARETVRARIPALETWGL